MTPAFPTQFIFLAAIPVNTNDKTQVFNFLGIDAYSQYVFDLGINKELNDKSLIDSLSILTSNKDFIKARKENPGPFYLVLPIGDHLRKDIESKLSDIHGSLIVNNEAFLKFAVPRIKEILSQIP